MVMGHSTGDARYILTGNSIADLEKGLAEMKRQIAAGITFSVCYGGDDTKVCNQYCDECKFNKEYDSEYSNDDCNDCDYDIIDSYGNCDNEYVCEEDTDWDICSVCTEEDCDDCPLMDEDEEEEIEVKEKTDKDKAVAEMTEEIIAVIKDILGM